MKTLDPPPDPLPRERGRSLGASRVTLLSRRHGEEGELEDDVLPFDGDDEIVLALEGVEVADEVGVEAHGEVLLTLDVGPSFVVAADGVVQPVAAGHVAG